MKLSLTDETIEQVAIAISTEALEYVQTDNRFADLYVDLLSEFIQDKIGNIDDSLKNAIICSIMDQTILTIESFR